MYIRKSSPYADPSGAPLVMIDKFELKTLTETGCFQWVKYDLIDLFDIPVTP